MATDRWTDGISTRLQSAWARVMRPAVEPDPDAIDVAAQARSLAPVVWLLGKVQSGKTSIVRTITGAGDAEIGAGFRPTTQTARIFEFPSDAPVIRFLDTRGLGEAAYDPSADIAVSEGRAHLVLAVVRALDQDFAELVKVLAEVRRRHPEWPVVVAQTTLHDAYAHGEHHPAPYPFAADGGLTPATPGVPPDLIRALARQRAAFSKLPGAAPVLFVPIDFTQPGDGFSPQDYGFDALTRALESAAPAGLKAAVRALAGGRSAALAARAQPHVLGYATAAAAADLVPVAGLVAVPGVQANMLHALAHIYGIDWDRQALTEFAAAVGTGALVRMAAGFGARELAKLVPIYGQTAGAAAAAATSFAVTFALGKAACHFLARRRVGAVDPDGVAAAYREGLSAAFKLARERGLDRTGREPATADGPREPTRTQAPAKETRGV